MKIEGQHFVLRYRIDAVDLRPMAGGIAGRLLEEYRSAAARRGLRPIGEIKVVPVDMPYKMQIELVISAQCVPIVAKIPEAVKAPDFVEDRWEMEKPIRVGRIRLEE